MRNYQVCMTLVVVHLAPLCLYETYFEVKNK